MTQGRSTEATSPTLDRGTTGWVSSNSSSPSSFMPGACHDSLQSINNKGAAAEGANTRTLASSSSFFGNDTRGQGLVLSPSTGHV